MKLEITIILIVSLILILSYTHYLKDTKEMFESNIKQKNKKILEHFSEETDIRKILADDEDEESDEKINEETNDNNKSNNSSSISQSQNNEDNNVSENPFILKNKENVCKVNEADSEDCLFGCGKGTKVSSMMAPAPSVTEKKTSLAEMMVTIEETEKICDMIDEKDRIRREKEEKESLKRQIELNKKFLIQQKAQNKQIEDLEKMVEAMKFKEEMNKVSLEKCNGKADQCLTEQEKKMLKLLRDKQLKSKSVKLNVNIPDFGEEMLNAIRNQLNLSDSELAKLLEAMKNGSLDLDAFRNSLNNNNDVDKSNMVGKTQYGGKCSNCKIDMDKYIHKCKVPCLNATNFDSKYKCPVN